MKKRKQEDVVASVVLVVVVVVAAATGNDGGRDYPEHLSHRTLSSSRENVDMNYDRCKL